MPPGGKVLGNRCQMHFKDTLRTPLNFQETPRAHAGQTLQGRIDWAKFLDCRLSNQSANRQPEGRKLHIIN